MFLLAGSGIGLVSMKTSLFKIEARLRMPNTRKPFHPLQASHCEIDVSCDKSFVLERVACRVRPPASHLCLCARFVPVSVATYSDSALHARK